MGDQLYIVLPQRLVLRVRFKVRLRIRFRVKVEN
jgi:hypothetical protein